MTHTSSLSGREPIESRDLAEGGRVGDTTRGCLGELLLLQRMMLLVMLRQVNRGGRWRGSKSAVVDAMEVAQVKCQRLVRFRGDLLRCTNSGGSVQTKATATMEK